MAYQFPPDIQKLIHERMASGEYRSEDELLRAALCSLREEAADLEAVQQAIDDWRAGDEGVPTPMRRPSPTGPAGLRDAPPTLFDDRAGKP